MWSRSRRGRGTGSGKLGARSSVRGTRNGEWGTGNAELGARNGERGSKNAELGVRKLALGVRNAAGREYRATCGRQGRPTYAHWGSALWEFRLLRPAFQAYGLFLRVTPGASPAGYRPSGLSGLAIERIGRARRCRRPALREGISQDSRDGVPRHGWRERAGFWLRDGSPALPSGWNPDLRAVVGQPYGRKKTPAGDAGVFRAIRGGITRRRRPASSCGLRARLPGCCGGRGCTSRIPSSRWPCRRTWSAGWWSSRTFPPGARWR